ncbi:MAG: glycosyltransferase family 9 protein [Bacteroidota bacterium]|nr:glycosyltransferase family 9 protein [Bacteroidota bacterium]
MCDDCQYYDKTDKKILIIKLGAAGDVVRTTPLLRPVKKEFPDSKIYWLTYSTELVPVNTDPKVDEVLKYNLQNISFIYETKFDLVINLDKDYEAISIMANISAKKKYGFTIRDGVCYPIGKYAEHKFLTGIFDNLSKENQKSYIQETFEICGYEFDMGKDKYLIDVEKEFDREWGINYGKKIVGLNTGCGERWTSRLWNNDYWIRLINKLLESDFEVILLGGSSEHERNSFLNEVTKAKYFGVFDLKTFINLVDKCDVIITQVTMSLHIAIALGKKVVLMNNIFNPNEFELYGNGEIIQPQKKCICYFMPKCVNKEYQCMDYLVPKDVYDACCRQLLMTNNLLNPI